MNVLAYLILCIGFISIDSAWALDPIEYNNPAEEARFKALAAELRCVMCQNQSIADSNAPIAHDLRLEVLRLMREGRSDAEIKQYLVERYSEFVLYEPPLRKGTWLLWAGPFLLLLAGAAGVTVIIKRKQRDTVLPEDDSGQEW